MKIFITIKPNAKADSVEKLEENRYRVTVKAPPDEGRANEALVRCLAEYFDLPKSRVSLLSGFKSKNKVVEIS